MPKVALAGQGGFTPTLQPLALLVNEVTLPRRVLEGNMHVLENNSYNVSE